MGPGSGSTPLSGDRPATNASINVCRILDVVFFWYFVPSRFYIIFAKRLTGKLSFHGGSPQVGAASCPFGLGL